MLRMGAGIPIRTRVPTVLIETAAPFTIQNISNAFLSSGSLRLPKRVRAEVNYNVAYGKYQI